MYTLRVSLKAFDTTSIHQALRRLAPLWAVVGPVSQLYPPSRVRRWSVIRSPHIHKHSREQFQLVRHGRVVVCPAVSATGVALVQAVVAGVSLVGVEVALSTTRAGYLHLRSIK